MKIKNTLTSKGSGRIGATLNRVVHGEQIVGAMPSKMTNPNTEAQQNTRSRFKLMSQLAASMKDVIAIPRDGLKSPRNLFVSQNFDQTTYDEQTATIDLNKVQLTKSLTPFVDVDVARDLSTGAITATIHAEQGTYDEIIVCSFSKNSEDELDLITSAKAAWDSTNSVYKASVGISLAGIVVYAYGLTYNDAAARNKYGQILANAGEGVAQLVAKTLNTMSGATFTKTVGVTVPQGESVGSTILYFVGGYALPANAGRVEGSKYAAIGQHVTLKAIEFSGYGLNRWIKDGETYASTTSITVEVTGEMTFVATFTEDITE